MNGVPVTIRDVWKRIPEVACTGACAPECKGVVMYEAELELMRERIPAFPNAAQMTAHQKCPALALGRCMAHDVRPTVCRLFGNAESLPCPYGCEKPKLSKKETSDIMDAAREAGGPVA